MSSTNSQQQIPTNQDLMIMNILASIKPVMQAVLNDLINDPNFRKIVISSVISVLNDREFRSSLKFLIIEVLHDEDLRRELRDLMRDVANPLRLFMP